MEFCDVVARRHMVRRFDPHMPVPDTLVRRALEHALRAPSAGFSQGWDFVVLRRRRERDHFWDVTTQDRSGNPDAWLTGVSAAPVLVLCCSDPGAYRERYARPDKRRSAADQGEWPIPYWDVDTGMAALLMLLTAVDDGLGALFFGVPARRHEAVRAAFAIPADRRLVGVVALGYPAGDRSRRRPRRRRTSDEVVHDGSFGAGPPAWTAPAEATTIEATS